MPSRLACIAIVAFWLATTGWLAKRELAPRWSAGAPPAVVIELADEAIRQPMPVRWRLYRNGEAVAPARTVVEYHEPDDSFDLNSTIFGFTLLREPISVKVEELRSRQRVERSGRLIGVSTDVKLDVAGQPIRFTLSGAVVGGEARPVCRVETPWAVLTPTLAPVPVTGAGALNPLHPVNKVLGLWAGRTWRQSLSDPLTDALRESLAAYAKKEHGADLSALLGRAGPTSLVAEVTGPETLNWSNAAHDCWVIRYRGEGYEARTWVRVSDGLVLRQDAAAAGEDWSLVRE